MKCEECGGEMTSARERYHYTASGLSSIYLLGVEVRRCSACDEEEVVIPRIADLHRAIARSLLRKPKRLSGEEVRFLRKEIGLSGVDFAARMGVAAETVSRWENDKEPVGAQADRLVRMIVADSAPKTDYTADELSSIKATDEAKPLRLELMERSRGWATEAGAA